MGQGDVVIEDAQWLISRKPEIFKDLANKSILVTGGAGKSESARSWIYLDRCVAQPLIPIKVL